MADHEQEGVASTASIAGHPIHPMLIPFPIAFLVGALVTDLVYWWNNTPFWAEASFWLVAAGLVTGAVAALFGLVDFLTIERARAHTAGWIHFLGNATALVLALISLGLRWGDPVAGVLPWGLTLSVIISVILSVTGWYGGELSYRHKIGVIGHDRQHEADVSTYEQQRHTP